MTLNVPLKDRLVAGVRGRAGVSIYGRQVNRRLGGALARVAFRLGLRPNHVTGLSGLTSALAVATLVLVRPSLVSGIVVWFLVVLAYALDSADGQLASLRGGGTPAGEWFDHTLDAGRVVAMHSAVLVMTYRFYDSRTVSVLPLVYLLVASVMFAAVTLAEILLRGHREDEPPADAAPAITLRGLLLLPLDWGIIALSFLFIGSQSAFPAVYGALLVLTIIIGAALFVKWFRQLSALSAA
jgi:phosphatidylglycerophosphate synthase